MGGVEVAAAELSQFTFWGLFARECGRKQCASGRASWSGRDTTTLMPPQPERTSAPPAQELFQEVQASGARAMSSGFIVLPERWPRVQFRVTTPNADWQTADWASKKIAFCHQ